ncbi:phosphatidylethanolamine-binding protein 4-like [Anneissia japonica]|uniref:phosphatidylethanolamine-binding protein 4-like n=1 Tax=Anneissia japonica TaxID=1529436 RepID=UPI0014254BFA|nr:phosphatidylethanolamine-binding protein 4-like [Anneissia japonica]
MVDPDAPSPSHTVNHYWLHWLVSSIDGETLRHTTASEGLISGETVVGYKRPSPPKGTGPHRYQFFLYEQTAERIDSPLPLTRSDFDLQSYIRQNNIRHNNTLTAVFEFVTQNTAH